MDQAPRPSESPRPWGVLGTWLWSVAILVAALFSYGVALVGLCVPVIARQPGAPIDGLMTHPLYDLVTTSVAVTVIALGAWLPVLLRDVPAREYLALRLPRLPQAVLYAVITLLWIAAILIIGPAFGHDPGLFLAERPQGPWVAMLAAAGMRFLGVPLAIELFARGFMLHGLTAGRRSAVPGLVTTTMVATVLHCFFFASGPIYWFLALFESLVLGMARLRSGSLLLPIVLHVAIVVGLFGGALFTGVGGP
jgi:hypothetical protein